MLPIILNLTVNILSLLVVVLNWRRLDRRSLNLNFAANVLSLLVGVLEWLVMGRQGRIRLSAKLSGFYTWFFLSAIILARFNPHSWASTRSKAWRLGGSLLTMWGFVIREFFLLPLIGVVWGWLMNRFWNSSGRVKGTSTPSIVNEYFSFILLITAFESIFLYILNSGLSNARSILSS